MIFVSEQHRPRKRFGQHFLINPHIADRIVAAAAPGDGEQVLEIGPGKGVLTELLLQQAGQVWAVEIDRDLIPELHARFGGNPHFHLIESDILSFDPSALHTDSRVRVVAKHPVLYYDPDHRIHDQTPGCHLRWSADDATGDGGTSPRGAGIA